MSIFKISTYNNETLTLHIGKPRINDEYRGPCSYAINYMYLDPSSYAINYGQSVLILTPPVKCKQM